MPAIEIKPWTTSLLAQLDRSRQRQLLLFEGSREWCDGQLAALSQLDADMLLLSNRAGPLAAIPFDRAETCLGGESRIVVIDLFDGFDPDVLSIAGGLVRAGGILVLLSPPGDQWDPGSDRYARWQDGRRSPRAFFVEYFFRVLREDARIGIFLSPGELPAAPTDLPQLEPTSIVDGQTTEQRNILKSLERWAAGRQRGCVLISAERGRGKSTCLGLLAAKIQSSCRILVTANSRQTAAALLKQVPGVAFVAPDRLLRECPEAELLLIDEAAMIPLPILRQLSRLYPKLVLATTTGGYEGTGQGFLLRFVAAMEARGMIRHRIESPVRWCRGDLLEAWLARCLLLQEHGRLESLPPVAHDDCRIELLPQPGEMGSWPVLREIYALLNSAHYRTRPSDLRMLMENPDLRLLVASSEGRVVGVALLNLEGGFDESRCAEIFYGRRRPQGHLLAQMLTAQAGLKAFAGYRGLRVQRIAVDPACRRQGIGSRLLQHARDYGRENGLDYLGASFALDPENARFWQQAGCRLVHVSFAQGKSSGNHSIAVLSPIGRGLDRDLELLGRRIQRQLPTWLTQFLQFMEADQVAALLRYSEYRYELEPQERDEVEAFARGNRGFELCFASLQKFVMTGIARGGDPGDGLLIEKAVQNRPWKMLERASGAEGRRQLQKRLRELVDALLEAC